MTQLLERFEPLGGFVSKVEPVGIRLVIYIVDAFKG